jgi:hypothetical protein
MQGRNLVYGGLQTQPQTLVKPWITYSSYHHGSIERWSKTEFGDHYSEMLFHLGVGGVVGFHYFNPPGQLDNSMPTLADHALLQSILNEMNELIGCAGRTWIPDLNMRWTDGFFLTGIKTASQTVWRFTPQNPSSTRVVTDGGSVIVAAESFQHDGLPINCTVEFYLAEAFQGKLSKSGWWVVQNHTESTVELVCASFRSSWPLPLKSDDSLGRLRVDGVQRPSSSVLKNDDDGCWKAGKPLRNHCTPARQATWWVTNGDGPIGGLTNLQFVQSHRKSATRVAAFC